MIKFILRKIFNKDKPEDTAVSLEVVKPKSSKKVYDEAVAQVIKEKMRGDLSNQLIEMCYTTEQVRDTNQAIEKYGSRPSEEQLYYLFKEFPKAIQGINRGWGSGEVVLNFNYTLFLDKLLERCDESV